MRKHIHRTRAGWVLVALTAAIATGCASDWVIAYPKVTAFGDRSPRLELTVKDAWIGRGEDRFGARGLGASHDIRVSRHCSGEWAVTYPVAAAELMPNPGTPLELWVQKGDSSAKAVGEMDSNGATALFSESAAVDSALFANGAVTIVVAAPSEEQVSFVRVGVLFSHQEQDKLKDVCPPVAPPPTEPAISDCRSAPRSTRCNEKGP